jgi:hypothetical protein
VGGETDAFRGWWWHGFAFSAAGKKKGGVKGGSKAGKAAKAAESAEGADTIEKDEEEQGECPTRCLAYREFRQVNETGEPSSPRAGGWNDTESPEEEDEQDKEVETGSKRKRVSRFGVAFLFRFISRKWDVSTRRMLAHTLIPPLEWN